MTDKTKKTLSDIGFNLARRLEDDAELELKNKRKQSANKMYVAAYWAAKEAAYYLMQYKKDPVLRAKRFEYAALMALKANKKMEARSIVLLGLSAKVPEDQEKSLYELYNKGY